MRRKSEVISKRRLLIATLTIIATSELGDKTQITAIVMTAKYGVPPQVFLGAMGGLALTCGMGVLIGDKISRYISIEKFRMASGVLFMTIGILTLLGLL